MNISSENQIDNNNTLVVSSYKMISWGFMNVHNNSIEGFTNTKNLGTTELVFDSWKS